MNYMSNPVVYNEATKSYEMPVGGGMTVFARVRRENHIVFIDHVEAPPALRGMGAAGTFMKNLMDHLHAENLQAVPLCGYAASWLQRHPEYEENVDSSSRV